MHGLTWSAPMGASLPGWVLPQLFSCHSAVFPCLHGLLAGSLLAG